MKIQKLNLVGTLVLAVSISACSQHRFTPIIPSDSASLGDSPTGSNPPGGNPVDIPVDSNLLTKIEQEVLVKHTQKNLDILLVLDDSLSMKPVLLRLAQRLSQFVRMLEQDGLNWQMCYTTTGGQQVGSTISFGQSKAWKELNGSIVLKKGDANLDQVFFNTINTLSIGANLSGDERGLKATTEHLQKNSSCYRTGASLAVILISDEDEASVGGDASRIKANDSSASYQALTAIDQPAARLAVIKSNLDPSAQFTFNSIIVQPGDNQCEAEQDLDEAPSYAGTYYAAMSELSGGGLGSICDNNYSKNLKLFKDRIVNTLKEVELQCEPYKDKIEAKLNGVPYGKYKRAKKKLEFEEALAEGSFLELSYECLKQKTESSP